MAQDTKPPGGFGQYHLFSLFGFEVRLDLSWVLLALLITWSLGAGVYPGDYPGLATRVYAWMGIAAAAGVFFSIVFHEFAHSLVARHFGIPIKGITLFIFGGVAEMGKEPPSAKSEFLTALAGPVASFLLAFVFTRAEALASAHAWPIPIIGVCHTLARINLIVAIFNLVPAFPLDGGRVLRSVLWRATNNLHAATRISSRIGSGFGVALIVLGVLALIRGEVIGGMWWFLIGVFLRAAAAASYRQLLVRDILQAQPVERFMRRDPVSVPPSITVRQWVEDYVYRHHFKMFPVVDGTELLGCITIERVKQIPRNEWEHRTVREAMDACSKTNTVPSNTEAAALLSTMLHSPRESRYLVVDNGRLRGIISLKDLLELIALRLEIEPDQG